MRFLSCLLVAGLTSLPARAVQADEPLDPNARREDPPLYVRAGLSGIVGVNGTSYDIDVAHAGGKHVGTANLDMNRGYLGAAAIGGAGLQLSKRVTLGVEFEYLRGYSRSTHPYLEALNIELEPWFSTWQLGIFADVGLGSNREWHIGGALGFSRTSDRFEGSAVSPCCEELYGYTLTPWFGRRFRLGSNLYFDTSLRVTARNFNPFGIGALFWGNDFMHSVVRGAQLGLAASLELR